MRNQNTLMKFDPATGFENPYPSHADQWRKYHGATAWLFNPWNGSRRHAADVGTDVFGLLIVPADESLYAAGQAASGSGAFLMQQGEIMGADARQASSIGRGRSA